MQTGVTSNTAAVPPLHGMTVVDFDSLLPGACVLAVLKEMGARIIIVKNPAAEAAVEESRVNYFSSLEHGVQVCYLDLKTSRGQADALALMGQADVVLEGLRPGKMAALGLGYEAAWRVNAGLVYASISGYGQTGPDAQLPGHDLNYMAAAGALALTASTKPAVAGELARLEHAQGSPIPFSDVGGAMYAVSAILAALLQRQSTQIGQWLDIALAETLVHQMSVRLATFHHKNIHGVDAQNHYLCRPGYGVFQCKDGQFVSLAALENKFFMALVDVLALTQFRDAYWGFSANRAPFAKMINEAIREQVRNWPSDALIQRLRDSDVPAMLLVNPDDVHRSEQWVQRQLFVNRESGALPRFPVRMMGMEA